jgi:hypothetical protein
VPANQYDQACRYLLRLFAVPLLAWLLRLDAGKLDFAGWLDTRGLPWPGEPDRTCDTVARLRDPEQGGLPFAVPVEFSVKPDPNMFGRGLRYLGGLWEEYRPSDNPGDRFEVALVVVNLRGRGRSSRRMRLTGTRLFTGLRVVERNLSRISARKALQRLEDGVWPPALLAWIPLFRGADAEDIIREWRRLADLQIDADVRKALGLAAVFAEAARRLELWRPAVEGLNVAESLIIKEWTANARKEGETKGRIEGKIETLLPFLKKLGAVPSDLEQAIRAVTDPARVDALIAATLSSVTIDDFRRAAGL